MKLEELKGKKILWGMTPKVALADFTIRSDADFRAYEERQKQLVGYYFYIDVWNMTARLAVMENKIGSARSSIVDLKGTTITESDLHTAIRMAGGFINLSGHYPISKHIMQKLLQELEQRND